MSSEIKSKCINCDILMCNPCSLRIHSKCKSSREHLIVELTKFGKADVTETVRSVNLHTMPCTIHNVKTCCLYCTDCDHPICSSCVLQSHQPHTLCDIDDIYQTKLTEVGDFKQKIENNLPFFKNEVEKLQRNLEEIKIQFEKNKKKIRDQKENIIRLLKTYTEEILHELEAKWKSSNDFINEEIIKMKRNKDDFEREKKQLDDALKSHQPHDVFTASKSIDKTLLTNSVCSILVNQTLFMPGNISNQSRSVLFGDLLLVPIVSTEFKWEEGGETVEVSGSFNEWNKKKHVSLQKINDVFTVSIDLPAGEYHYKYIVDGIWMTNKKQPIKYNAEGMENNVIFVA